MKAEFYKLYHVLLLYFLVLIWGAIWAGENFVKEYMVILTAIAAMGSLPVLTAFVFRDVGRTMSVLMTLFFFMIFVLNQDQSQFMAQVLPIGQLRLISMGQLKIPFSQAVFVDILWIAVCCAGAYLAFFRAKLK